MKPMEQSLRDLGRLLRDHRKRLGVSAVAAAEASGMSRITLYRIEKGEPSVAMGAYLSAILALGLTFRVTEHQKRDHAPTRLPKKIPIAQHKQLKRLAWQLGKTVSISPQDALNLYERNWRHIDFQSMDARERNLLEALLAAFGRERPLV
ncbi:MAG: helix-turn-helix domain-containing protein [Bdellovibrionales bacterium]|nr:helix-turn-helix domain-containing protein [Bdellovibrionales bacterium]